VSLTTRDVGVLIKGPGMKQFAKFCIIGASSTVIDFGILNLLTRHYGWNWVPARTLSFAVAVTNGFVWNCLWTFRGLGTAKRHEQYLMFTAVNIVGLLLNLLIMQSVMLGANGGRAHHGNPPPLLLNSAMAVAVVFVSIWNFLANKHWTFRHRPS
jgi:putative flippase GtrA